MSSPYAAPNSPIASSKRARVSKDKELRSPSGKPDVRPLGLKVKTDEVIFSPPGGGGVRGSTPRDEDPPSSSASAAAKVAEAEVASRAATEVEENDIEEFDPYIFIKGLPPHASVVIRGKKCLPPRPRNMDKNLKTLTLDLDETLVHCSIEPVPNPDIIFSVNFQGVFYEVYVRKRPHLDVFLQTVARMFEVVVFTASQKVYADKLLDLIDPKKNLIQHRLFRDACLCVQGNFIKDLSVLDRDMQKVVLVDNSPHAYGYNVNNGVPILSWFDDERDSELLKLVEFLKRIEAADDVRHVVRDQFKTYKLVAEAGKIPYRGMPPPLV